MGWNSFGCGITEAQVRQAADAMVSSGMRDADYQYVVVDDCWFDPNRDAQGNLRAHPTKFPSGMKALGDYLHARGLKFGIYQAPLEKTCAQGGGTFPSATGSLGHEYQDARTFASWAVDYLTYDWCSGSGTRDEQIARISTMRDALRSTGRPIVYSINSNSFHAPIGDKYDWGDVADLWRTTEDLLDIWQSNSVNSYPMGVTNVVNVTAPLAAQTGPGNWDDPDMLVAGRPGLTLTESRSHFALWALMAAPLMAGNDLRTMSPEISALLRNPRLIAVNQISAGVPAHGVAVFRVSGGSQIPNTITRLRGAGASRCVDVDNFSTAPGATVLIWDCHTGANQLWTTWAGGEVRVFGDKGLDAFNQGTANGTRLILWTCNGQNNQKWNRV